MWNFKEDVNAAKFNFLHFSFCEEDEASLTRIMQFLRIFSSNKPNFKSVSMSAVFLLQSNWSSLSTVLTYFAGTQKMTQHTSPPPAEMDFPTQHLNQLTYKFSEVWTSSLQVWRDPAYFDENWLNRIKTEVGDNWRLKVFDFACLQICISVLSKM